MTKQEFEKRIGTEVSNDTFDYANRVYMAAGNIDKDAFCKDWREEHVSESRIISYLVCEIEDCRGTIKNQKRQLEADQKCLDSFTDQMVDFLVLQAEKWSASDLRRKAIDMVGVQEYIRRRIVFGFGLWDDDRTALVEILKSE